MGEAFDMYRRSEIGMALTETLDEMVGSGALSPKQAIGIFLQFDKELDDYLKGCRFLPNLNNEILGERNAPYKERLSSLENLVLIMG